MRLVVLFVVWVFAGYLLAINGFGPYTPYGNEDGEAYLRRFTSFLFKKGVIQYAPLAGGASAQVQAAHDVLVTAYNDSR